MTRSPRSFFASGFPPAANFATAPRGVPFDICPRVLRLLVAREAHAEAELGVVLEEGVGPRRPAAVSIRTPRGRREVPAIDRRAAGGIRHQRAVAEELAHELQVRRLAATGTRA